jgi:hypothetical protein
MIDEGCLSFCQHLHAAAAVCCGLCWRPVGWLLPAGDCPSVLVVVGVDACCCCCLFVCLCLQVDKDTFEMLKAINMSGLPGVQLAQVR